MFLVWGFLLLSIGACLGMLLMAMLAVGRDADDRMDGEE